MRPSISTSLWVIINSASHDALNAIETSCELCLYSRVSVLKYSPVCLCGVFFMSRCQGVCLCERERESLSFNCDNCVVFVRRTAVLGRHPLLLDHSILMQIRVRRRFVIVAILVIIFVLVILLMLELQIADVFATIVSNHNFRRRIVGESAVIGENVNIENTLSHQQPTHENHKHRTKHKNTQIQKHNHTKNTEQNSRLTYPMVEKLCAPLL